MGKYDHISIDGAPLTEQEKFVLEKVEKGEPADLKKRFGESEENRRLRARFVEELFICGLEVQVSRHGIRIGNGVISESINLELATVSHSIIFNSCLFREPVDFGHAYFKSHFAISGSTFHASAKFRQMKVGRNLICRKTTFIGPVDFARVQVSEDFDAKGAHFENKENNANFNSIRVGQNASFNGALFQGPVDFTLAKVEGNFSIELLIEDGVEKDTVFENSVNFAGSNTNGQFQAERTRFEGIEAVFKGMKVRDNVLFDGALFKGDVDFSAIIVDGNFSIMPVEKERLKLKSSFKGNVNFAGARIGRQFQSETAYFGDTNKLIIFNNMMVGQSAFFDRAVFHGQVDFCRVTIKGQLSLVETQFLNNQPSIFEGMTVGMSIIIRDALFHGGIRFNHASFMDLFMQGQSSCSLIPLIDLEHAVVQRELRIENAKIEVLEASYLQVTGPTILSNVSVIDSADFQNASCQILNLREVTWPVSGDKVLLEGLTYNAINAGTGKEDWKKLLALVRGSRFNTQNYSQLETYFARCGYRDRADEVYITGKRQASNRLILWKKWLTQFFWGGLAGYGRKPWQVLYVILPLVALGTFLFAPEFTAKSLESYGWLNQMKPSHPWIIQFLVSLDRFLPGVDLGLAKEWSPACVGLFTLAYWYFLKLAGWITIPIALAAIYTRIK